MLRGIRRIFAFSAIVWAVLWTIYFGRANPYHEDRGGDWWVFMLIAAGIYSLGWVVTYLANGFKKPRGRIIDL